MAYSFRRYLVSGRSRSSRKKKARREGGRYDEKEDGKKSSQV